MSELDIPDDAADLGADALRGYRIAESDLIDAAAEVLQAAGPHLVAAELRRIATDLDAWSAPGDTVLPNPATLHVVAARLRARADELDTPGHRTDRGPDVNDVVWIRTTVECGQAVDTDYVSVPRVEWEAMTDKQQEDHRVEIAVAHQNEFAPCGASVVDESEVPDDIREENP